MGIFNHSHNLQEIKNLLRSVCNYSKFFRIQTAKCNVIVFGERKNNILYEVVQITLNEIMKLNEKLITFLCTKFIARNFFTYLQTDNLNKVKKNKS